jgi:hypothetical protein
MVTFVTFVTGALLMAQEPVGPTSDPAAQAAPSTPAQLWKRMPAHQRLRVATHFWEDREATAQQAEAIVEIARRLKFRVKSVQGLAVERKAKYLASMPLSDALANYVLVAYHLATQRPLMGAFLDQLGIAHENGVLAGESITPPDRRRLADAARAVLATYPRADVEVYLRTLLVQDPGTWGSLAEVIDPAIAAAAAEEAKAGAARGGGAGHP